MAIKYRLKPANATNPNAVIEQWDLDSLKTIRGELEGGGEITAVEVTYFVINDPSAATFETYDEANQKKESLQEETYSVGEAVALIDPQPEGLND